MLVLLRDIVTLLFSIFACTLLRDIVTLPFFSFLLVYCLELVPSAFLPCLFVRFSLVVVLSCIVFLYGEAGFVPPAKLACLCTLPRARVLGLHVL